MVKWKSPLSENEKEGWESISIKSKSGGLIRGLFAKTKTSGEKATVVLGHPMGKEAKHLQSLLFIYSESDRWVPLDAGKRFEQNSSVPAELWMVKNAKHAEIMKSPHKEIYQAKILEYFNRCSITREYSKKHFTTGALYQGFDDQQQGSASP